MPSDVDALVAPRSTGEIITDAVEALRRSLRVVFPLALPLCAVHLVLWETAVHLLSETAAQIPVIASADAVTQAALLPRLLAMFGAFAASYLVQQVLAGAVTVVGARLAAGRATSFGEAFAATFARGAPLLLTSALFLAGVLVLPTLAALVPLAAALAGVLLDLPPLTAIGGALAPLVFVVLGVGLGLRWYLATVVVMTEGASLGAALARSSALTAPRGLPFAQTPRFRLSVLFVMSLVLTTVIQLLFVVPRLGFAAIAGVDAGAVSVFALPPFLLVPLALVEVATNAIAVPFVALLLCSFTLDLRVRYEGADLTA